MIRGLRFVKTAAIVSAIVSLLSLSGCGKSSGAGLIPVSGTVTFDGKPVARGNVAFVPVDDTGRPASASIDSTGRFAMSTYEPGDGMVAGRYRVAVTVEDQPTRGDDQGNLIPATYLSPPRYMNPETSGLEVTVESGKKQDLRFDLVP